MHQQASSQAQSDLRWGGRAELGWGWAGAGLGLRREEGGGRRGPASSSQLNAMAVQIAQSRIRHTSCGKG
jgi:hypothetical protein